MKRVQLRKYRLKKKTTKYFYDVGRTSEGKPQYSIQIYRKLLYYDSYGTAWLTFPIRDAELIKTVLKQGQVQYKIVPNKNHVVYDFYLVAGVRGDIELEISADCDFKETLIYTTHVEDRNKPGFGKGVLVCLPSITPLYIHWIRTGFMMSGFIHEGQVRLDPDGKVVKLGT